MNKKGFTLIEILFALTIVGIVAAVCITGLRANIKTHEVDAFSKKALQIYSSAVYEIMNSPQAPTNFRCEHALEYISKGTITGSTSTTTYTTGDGMQWTCNSHWTVTITYPDELGSCQIVTKSTGLVQGGTCGDLPHSAADMEEDTTEYGNVNTATDDELDDEGDINNLAQ
ncbi:type II secretion system protein [bacterium]|nr:type II secretion system protein [bacterium]